MLSNLGAFRIWTFRNRELRSRESLWIRDEVRGRVNRRENWAGKCGVVNEWN